MAATIKNIAELSGVSAGTVDRVLNNRGRVSPEVEKRVRKIAEALNYHPNSVAKSLALRRKSFKVAVISHVDEKFLNYAVNQAFRGILDAASEIQDYGIEVLVKYCKNFDCDDQVRLIQQAVDAGVSAVAIIPINVQPVWEKLASLNVPVFCFTNDIPAEYPHYFIGIDNFMTGSIAAGLFHLIAPQVKSIAIVSSSLSMMGNSLRLDSFRATLTRYYDDLSICAVLEAVNDDFMSYKKIKAMLDEHNSIDSLFFMSGAVEGGITAIEEAGMLGKIAIVSIDLSEKVRENLLNGNIAATIHQNPYQHGYRTIRCIFDYLTTGKLPDSDHIFINSDILIRECLQP